MPPCTIVVDTRERALLDAVKDAVAALSVPAVDKPDIAIEALDLGDIALRSEGVDLFLYERKTLSDLAASIRDGRYRSQKPRLLAERANGTRIGLLVEVPHAQRRFLDPACNDKPFRNTGLPAATLRSSLVHSEVRDGLGLHLVNDVGESAAFLVARALAVGRFASEIAAALPQKRERESDVVEAAVAATTTTSAATASQEALAITMHKKRRSDNATPLTRFADQLMAARGIGSENALAVATRFGSMAALVEAFDDVHAQRKADVAVFNEAGMPLTAPDKKHAKRCAAVLNDVEGVGPLKAVAIYEALYGVE